MKALWMKALWMVAALVGCSGSAGEQQDTGPADSDGDGIPDWVEEGGWERTETSAPTGKDYAVDGVCFYFREATDTVLYGGDQWLADFPLGNYDNPPVYGYIDDGHRGERHIYLAPVDSTAGSGGWAGPVHFGLDCAQWFGEGPMDWTTCETDVVASFGCG